MTALYQDNLWNLFLNEKKSLISQFGTWLQLSSPSMYDPHPIDKDYGDRSEGAIATNHQANQRGDVTLIDVVTH